MFKLYLALISVALVAQINADNVPAFIFGDKTLAHFPALRHLRGDEFATLVKSQDTKNALTVVFVEEKLSVEDFSQCRLKTKTCFENLNSIERKSYLSSVDEPVDSLLSAFGKKKSITVSGESDLKDAKVDEEKILFVYFDEVENAEDFYNHDALIDKIYKKLKEEHENVIAVYTGIHPSFTYSQSLKRKVREAEAAPAEEKPVDEKPAETEPKAAEEPKPAEEPKQVTTAKPVKHDDVAERPRVVIAGDRAGALVALSGFTINNVTIDLNTLVVSVERDETSLINGVASAMTVKLTGTGHTFEMFTVMSGGTWSVQRFALDGSNEDQAHYYPNHAVYSFGHRYSFGCVDLVIKNSKRETDLIRLSEFQFQPNFEPMSEPFAFSDYVSDCTGFFSAPIWGALFVVILLVSILSWGLYMMMDIRTMDRFDDPKGKTIVINAQE